MLDKIAQLVREQGQDAIVRNPQIPDDKNEEAINVTANSLMEQLTGRKSGFDLKSLTGLFQGADDDVASNPTTNKLTSGVADNLMKKLGIDNAAAMAIAGKVIPMVLARMKSKSNDPNDQDFDLNDMLDMFGKGKAGNILGTLKGLLGRK